MTGPEHYARAQELLAGRLGHLAELGCRTTTEAVALAQVHATLALAAATMAGVAGEPLRRDPTEAATP